MTTTDRCEHGEIPAACMECLGKPTPRAARVRPRADTRPFTPRYDGRCSECDEAWAADDDAPIVRLTDGSYAHATCAEPVGTP
jgi:hypothetical protein